MKWRFGLCRCAADAGACSNDGALETLDLGGLEKESVLREESVLGYDEAILGEAFMEAPIIIHNYSFRETRSWQGFAAENRLQSHSETRVRRQR